jgi:AcrR family transcriptional regulator
MSRFGARAHRPALRAVARRRPRTYHHGDLRTALLSAVQQIIRERGVGFVSIREVARRARVSHAAPAHHFGSKAGLLTAFATEGYERLAVVVRERVAQSGALAPPDVLAAMGQGYVMFAVENPEHFGIMYPGEWLNHRDPAYRRAADGCYGPLVDVIRRAGDEGYLSADLPTVAAAAWSLVHGLAALWLSGRIQARTGATDAAALSTAVTRLFVGSVMRGSHGATGEHEEH